MTWALIWCQFGQQQAARQQEAVNRARAKIQIANFQVQYLSASILPIEPQVHNQSIHRNHVNGLIMIFRFCVGKI